MKTRFVFGLRMLRACAVGVVLCLIWLFVWQPGLQPVAKWPATSHYGVFGVVLSALSRSVTKSPGCTLAVMFCWPLALAATLHFARMLVGACAKQFGSFGDGFYAPICLIARYGSRILIVVCWAAGGYMVYHSPAMQRAWPDALTIACFDYLLPMALLWGPAVLVLGGEYVSENTVWQRFFRFGRGGSARWAGPASFRKKRSRWTSKDGSPFRVKGNDIYLGCSTFADDFLPRHIGIQDDAHHLVVGMTGSGKSISSIWPNLKARTEAAAIVFDPKAEHHNECSAARGGGVLLDPFNESGKNGVGYNLLSEIDIHSDNARIMLTAVSDGCVLKEGGNAQHFTDMARLLLEGLIAHTLSSDDPEHHNLPFIFDSLQGLNADGFADPAQFDALLTDMRMNNIAGGIAQQAASSIEAMGERERGSVLSTIFRSLKWVSDPVMRKQLQGSSLRFSDVAAGKVKTVWIVLPTRCMDEYARWVRCLINVSIRTIESQKKKPKRSIVYVLDEFPKMRGALESIEDGIVTLRAAKIKLVPYIQNIGQLIRDYPKNWQTFVSSSTVQCFGVNDIETARFVSSLLGETLQTRKEKEKGGRKRVVSEIPRPLMTPTEVMRELGKTSPMQIVIPNTGPPMRLTRLAHKPIRIEGQRFHASPSAWQIALDQ